MKPVLHVSGMFGAQRHNIALIVPLAVHPVNKNEIICFDLSADPNPMFEMTSSDIAQYLYTRTVDLPPGIERPGLKTIHINRCPVLVTAKMADPATAERLGISGDVCRKHLAALRAYRRRDARAFEQKIQTVYSGRKFNELTDPDRMLYSGGFFSAQDKRVMERVRGCSAQELSTGSFSFEDARLPEMLFRYRARNFPESLSSEEQGQWEEHRFAYLSEPEGGASLCLEQYHEVIDGLLASENLSQADQNILNELLEYSDTLLA